jgi:chromosome segregation ATPase
MGLIKFLERTSKLLQGLAEVAVPAVAIIRAVVDVAHCIHKMKGGNGNKKQQGEEQQLDTAKQEGRRHKELQMAMDDLSSQLEDTTAGLMRQNSKLKEAVDAQTSQLDETTKQMSRQASELKDAVAAHVGKLDDLTEEQRRQLSDLKNSVDAQGSQLEDMVWDQRMQNNELKGIMGNLSVSVQSGFEQVT